MTTPTGTITLGNVNTELGHSATANITMNNADVRGLAGKPSGIISMNDLRGKSAFPSIAKPDMTLAGVTALGWDVGHYTTSFGAKVLPSGGTTDWFTNTPASTNTVRLDGALGQFGGTTGEALVQYNITMPSTFNIRINRETYTGGGTKRVIVAWSDDLTIEGPGETWEGYMLGAFTTLATFTGNSGNNTIACNLGAMGTTGTLIVYNWSDVAFGDDSLGKHYTSEIVFS